MLTDSGGFQVFSLDPQQRRLDDDGVTFRSRPTTASLAPALARVGAWPSRRPSGPTSRCSSTCAGPARRPTAVVARPSSAPSVGEAGRGGPERRLDDQLLFGIVQGGVDAELRAEVGGAHGRGRRSTGFGIGGLSVGETRAEMVPAIAATTRGPCPADRPRYVMGLGDAAGMVEAVAHGVDLFDCVLPTRLGRHGTILTDAGRLNLRNACLAATDDEPLDPGCPCRVCARWSGATCATCSMVGEPTAARLATLHNLAWTLGLVDRMRAAIEAGHLRGAAERGSGDLGLR